ncbi:MULTISPECIES: D-arabinono-1,4-lactone oxidase [unclassified Leifsonia]|uniref:D-arabinono-1,4-lactone oxidase n=1 Tax=unclassified Leifsonia TaxID=2663824 RepID=UPI00070037AB|nr:MULTISPECIES: D-arabinono-1,4-lactone oxidase [unclassified Leifsonia]KQX05629.1 FAD-binding protein [Leifsonia sp. Root1293]KRA09264.1 FAD-binding protein [Leifsonia sp. Root60]
MTQLDVGTNWAGNLAYGARQVMTPHTYGELAGLLRSETHVRMLGTRHSFNRIADTTGVLVSLAALHPVLEIDSAARTVRVSGALRYGDLAIALEKEGWALANLASLPHISVAGSVATGTHGSGDGVRSLAGSVAGVELMTASGDVRTFVRGDVDFDGVVVSLGALGAVTTVTLDIEPTYAVAQTVYENLEWDDVLADLSAVTSLGYSTSMFTTWRDPDVIDQLWVKRRVSTDAGAAGAAEPTLALTPADGPRHPLPGVSPVNCTDQLGAPGAWLDRLPHFKLGFTPSNGAELQSEYLVPRARAAEALEAVRLLAPRIAPLLQVCEVRTVAADELWLSPAFGTDVVGIHFTWLPDQPAVEAFLPLLEAALGTFAARPHWGKISTLSGAEVAALYPRFVDFAVLRHRLDPRGVFRNAFTEALGL